jgi:hypothetical protein
MIKNKIKHPKNHSSQVGWLVFGAWRHSQQYFSYIYGGGHIYWWKELENTEKTIYLSPVTDKLYHINNVVSSTPHHERGSNLQLHR